MILDIEQEGKGPMEILQAVPQILQPFLLAPARPFVLIGPQFRSLMQQFSGPGFSAWYSRYWAESRQILVAKGGIPVLELRIALKNLLQGTWDKVPDPALPVHHFQMAFVPYVATRAIFEGGVEYQSFDVHFELAFLEAVGIDYHLLDKFIAGILRQEPAQLAPHPYPCTREMIQAVQTILKNDYSAAGKQRILANHVSNILIGALETVSRTERIQLPLSHRDKEALHRIREIIAASPKEWLGNEVLLGKVFPHLNAFKLHYGFKRLFGMNPYEYFQQVRFEEAKRLLEQGNKVYSVAYELDYESATTFIKAFKQRFGVTPKQWK